LRVQAPVVFVRVGLLLVPGDDEEPALGPLIFGDRPLLRPALAEVDLMRGPDAGQLGVRRPPFDQELFPLGAQHLAGLLRLGHRRVLKPGDAADLDGGALLARTRRGWACCRRLRSVPFRNV